MGQSGSRSMWPKSLNAAHKLQHRIVAHSPPNHFVTIASVVAFKLRVTLLTTIAALSLPAEDHWQRIRTGPFEVLSPAGERPMRRAAADAEQFRHALGELLGVKETTTVWPIRIVVLKNAKSVPGSIAMGRDSWITAIAAGETPTPEWRKALARILIDDNTGRMPLGIESGLITLISTLEINGPKLTFGTPPSAAERTRDWARLHLFATQPEYSGRLRILLSNLAHGAFYDNAFRNAFEKPAAEMEKRVDAYFAAGSFSSVPFSGRALSEKDFTVREAESYEGRIALADLALADPAKTSEAETAYKALTGPEAQEGLALLAARRKDPAAIKLFESATTAGSKNPRAWLGTTKKEGVIKAIELNPKWPDPHVRLAELGTAPNVKAAELGKAAALAPRDPELWKSAALAYAAANQFSEATKAWAGAERAAIDEQQREQLRQQRIDNEGQRAAFEAAERKRLAEEEARDLDRLRNQAIAEVKAAEAKANKEMAAGGAVPTKVEQWWEGPGGPPQKAAGTLQRVDCLAGGSAKLTVETGPKAILRLLVRDPGKIVLTGGGQLSLGCGPQRPARPVSIEYSPVKDAKLGTAGEVQVVEFK